MSDEGRDQLERLRGTVPTDDFALDYMKGARRVTARSDEITSPEEALAIGRANLNLRTTLSCEPDPVASAVARLRAVPGVRRVEVRTEVHVTTYVESEARCSDVYDEEARILEDFSGFVPEFVPEFYTRVDDGM